jgi:uracil-DNA glycosylase family 4
VTRGQISARQHTVLHEMGIDVWMRRGLEFDSEPPAQSSDMVESPAVATSSPDGWSGLNAEIRACTACGLHASRTQAVCGVGDEAANWLVIGEAPGEDEEQVGEPFVGPAGQLLNQMLIAAGQPREQVYTANLLKCRPPNNRDPQAAEVDSCMPFLERQIRLLNPQLILLLGRVAAQNLLQTETPIDKLRGRVHQHSIAGRDIPVVVTHHPGYLLRSPAQKREAWEDLQLAMKLNADFS